MGRRMMRGMAINMGPPEGQTDAELLQHLAFWRRKVREYSQSREPEVVAQGRSEVERFRVEAVRRGLIPPPELDF
ncbi:hypothetical protein GCM10027088_33480 [Nocardia goodfellowii]|uniref:Uncharacterized protein n=1 Tax=Nocardia goodfellowii TaxID=882446 RepID=A0ABS4Q871_9NOCA|nr:hypothetical protein [Nocardia goodfellowii]